MTVEVYNVYGQNNAPVLYPGSVPILVTTADNVNGQWGLGPVAGSNRSEDVIVKYTGNFTPIESGTTYITAPADDGTRLYLDGTLYINDWYDKGGGGSTADVPTTAGDTMDFEFWYYENGGGAHVALLWYTEMGWQVIPSTAFDVPSVVVPTPIVPVEPDPVLPPVVEPPVEEPLPEPEQPAEPQEPVVEPSPVTPTEPEVVPTEQPSSPPEPVSPEPVPSPSVISYPVVVEPDPVIDEEPVVVVEPEPEVDPAPVEEEQQTPETLPEPEEPQQEPEVTPEEPIEESSLEEPITLANGVVIEAAVARAFETIASPSALVSAIFTNPAEVFTALANVGADMSPEVREQSEKVVVAAVIVGNIATSAATAAGAAAHRRKP